MKTRLHSAARLSLPPATALAALLAAATILGTLNASADIILYEDNFDGDGIGANAGIGGGLKIAGGLYADWVESPSGITFGSGGNGGTNQSLASINSFDLSGGFTLTVTYNASVLSSGTSSSFLMGLLDAALNRPYSIGGGCVTATGVDPMAGGLLAAVGANDPFAYGIGFVVQGQTTTQKGLVFANGTTTTSLSDAQSRTTGTHTFVMTMDGSGGWSYKVDAAAATTGTLGAGFDLTRRFKFVVYGQKVGVTISSVKLTVPDNPNLVAWDTNGTDAGASDGITAAGTWGGNTNWNTDHIGGSGGSLADWAAGNKAVFAAGTNATGSYAVAVDGTRDISGLTFQEGNVTISGGTALRLVANSPVDVLYGSTPGVATLLSDDGTPRSLTKVGVGSLALSNANTYTDLTNVTAGTLSVPSLAAAGAGSPIGSYASAGAGGLVLTGGTFQFTGATASTDRGFTLAKTSTVDVSATGGALPLGACSLGASTLNVTGGAGSRLNLGDTMLTGAATLNPTTAALSLASVDGAFNLTLDGTASGNAITGSLGSGAATLTKSNIGAWTLSGLSFRTGASAVNGGGTLILDYSTVDDSKLADGAALTLGGANLGSTLTLKGGSHPEIVSATTLSGGGTFLTRDGGGSKLRMNAITRQAGGTISFADATVADTDTNNT
ncbi:MAG: beta strand repeat-containing protein, partial [Luteolibacter sp.]